MDQGFLAGPHFCKNTACRARPDPLSVFFRLIFLLYAFIFVVSIKQLTYT